ncbi:MAG: hypothetical protein ACRCYS_08840, partial [Beijerinckiaceae bacterium]
MAMNPHTVAYSAVYAEAQPSAHAGPSLLGMGAASDAGFAVTCLTGAAVVESLATLGDTMQAATPFQSLFW